MYTPLSLTVVSLGSLLSFVPPTQAAYTLKTRFAGDTFFDGWSFWGNRDNLTNGAVYYVSELQSKDLAYTNGEGNVVIKVDNTSTVAYGGLRDSVRITTTETYGIGSLFVLDALHTPYGCSVWPAMWSHAVSWPSGGCYASPTSETSPNGILQSTNCDYTVNANQGCTFTDTRNSSYGAGFAQNGGGVFAAELSSDAISVWFFPRSQIPNDLRDLSSSPDPSTWGAPTAYYPQSSCNINQYFAAQQLTINIALCGDWAGQPGVFNPTCSGVCTDMVQDPSNYDNAYFEIASVRVYDGGLDTRSKAAASAVIGSIGGDASPQTSRAETASRLGLAALGFLTFSIGYLYPF